ncbi:MAG: hypothetical protein IBX60_05575 [Candidatus Aminicenantes bacterium]|nr:hypothetical protein [Candidatus Aminicenantes bacterium]
MKNKFFFCFLILIFISGFVHLNGQGILLKKDVYVAQNETQENIITFGGNILVEGKVKDSIVSFGGTVTIKGEVNNLILGFGSEIYLESTAIVHGDIVCIGGTLHKNTGAIVEGDTVYFETSEEVWGILKQGLFGAFGISLAPFFLAIKLITISIWFLLAILLAAIFPRQISFASSQIRKTFWPIFGTGVLSIVIFTGLVIFSAVLSLVLIGIPILLSLIVIGIVIKVFSRVVLFCFFGDSLARAFNSKNPSLFLQVVLGFILVSIISLIPFIGSLFSFVLSIIGWGVIILTKFGTTENWFKRNA